MTDKSFQPTLAGLRAFVAVAKSSISEVQQQLSALADRSGVDELTRLLTATCVGLLSESTERDHT
jgi:hypothetical protein